MRLVLLFLCAGALTGCLFTDARADGGSPLSDAVSGAVGGVVEGGPIGGLLGGVIGLVAGLGASLRERSKRKQAEGSATVLDKFAGHAVAGVGEFLDESLDESVFAGLDPRGAYELAKDRLKSALKRRMDSVSKALVEDKKAV